MMNGIKSEEKAALVTIEESNRRVPIYLGIADITTRECVRWAKEAEKMGTTQSLFYIQCF